MATLEEMQLIARLVIGGLLIGAGLVKLRNIEQFQRAVTAYDLIPAPFARYVAVAVVPAELVTGAALVAGLAVTISGAAAAVLLAFFTGAVAINLARGRTIACGCRLRENEPISAAVVYRNGLLLAIIGMLVVLPEHPWSLSGGSNSATTAETADTAVALVMTAVFVAAIVSVTELLRVLSRPDEVSAQAGAYGINTNGGDQRWHG